jgi:hypothetical protein
MNLWRGWNGILLVMALVMPPVTSAATAADKAPAADAAGICVWSYCATQRQLDMAGLVLGAAAVGTAVVAYTMGPHAAMATAGGFLVFSHFLFDVVPLAIGGVAAWVYGPQVWEWLGFKRAAKATPPAGT